MAQLDEFTPAWMRQALTQEGRRRTAAGRLQEEIARSGGAPAAIAALEQWVSRTDNRSGGTKPAPQVQ